jgi:hypothetical protein
MRFTPMNLERAIESRSRTCRLTIFGEMVNSAHAEKMSVWGFPYRPGGEVVTLKTLIDPELAAIPVF